MKLILLTIIFMFSFLEIKAYQLTNADSHKLMSSTDIEFVENKGQITDQFGNVNRDVLFIAKIKGGAVYVRKDGISFAMHKIDSTQLSNHKRIDIARLLSSEEPQEYPEPVQMEIYRVDMLFNNSTNSPKVEGLEILPDYNNYYLAQCPDGITHVRKFKRVYYEDVYENIDFVLYVNNAGVIQYDFIVKPSGNPDDVNFTFKGADSLQILSNGNLVVSTPFGNIEQNSPHTYHENSNVGKNNIINSKFELNSDNSISFHVDNYDKSKALIIDPISRLWGTYYDGGGNSYAHVMTYPAVIIKTDSENNVYLLSNSLTSNEIATAGSHQAVSGGSLDAYLVKFNGNGIRQWATFYGGSGTEYAFDLCNDSQDNIYITGSTQSSTTSISTPGAFQEFFHGNEDNNTWDAFLVKFNKFGIRIWGTYYGGTQIDNGIVVSVDGSDNVIMAGSTRSDDFMSTNGAHQESNGGGGGYGDAFLVKFNSSGTRLWATYYGGNERDGAQGISVDKFDNIFIGGITNSGNAISTIGAYQETYNGNSDAFIAKFDKDGSREWGTYFGGLQWDESRRMVTDKYNNLYILGTTASNNSISTTGAHQKNFGGGSSDAFLAKFDNSGNRSWATYVGGYSAEANHFIVIDKYDNLYLSGSTYSDSAIATPGSYQENYAGGIGDAYLIKFRNNGKLLWGTYYGGTNRDFGNSVAIDNNNYIYLAGVTNSTDSIATPDSHQCKLGDEFDAYLVKFGNSCDSLTAKPNTIKLGDMLCLSDTIITVKLTNPGSQQILIDKSSFSKGDKSKLQIINDGSFLIEGNDSLEIRFRIKPYTSGFLNDSLIISYNTLCDMELIIPISGYIYLIDFELNPSDTLDFGILCPNVVKDTTITIRNLSSVATYFRAIQPNKSFKITGNNPFLTQFAVGQTKEFKIQFSSKDTGVHFFNLNVVDTCGNTKTLVLKGEVNGPEINIVSDLTICQNDTITIGDSATNGTPPYKYAWYPNTGINEPESPVINISPKVTSKYYLSVTDSKGCTAIDSIQINVNSVTKPKITGNINVIEFTTNKYETLFNVDYSYLWTCLGGTISGENNQNDVVIDWEGIGIGLLIVEVTDLSTNCKNADTLIININALGDIIVNIEPSISLCLGDSIEIGSPSPATGGVKPYKFKWTPETGLSDVTIPNPIASPIVTTVYTLSVTDTRGTTVTTDVEVIVHPKPMQKISGNKDVVSNSTETYLINSNGFNIVWTCENGTIITQDNSSITIEWSNESNGLVIAQITDLSTNCKNIDTLIVNIRNGQELVVNLESSISICSGESVNIGSSSPAIGGTPPYQYSWTPIAGLDFANIANPTASPTTTTTYTLTVTDSKNNSAFSSVEVIVNPKTTPQIFGKNTVYDGDIEIYSANDSPNIINLWSVEGGVIQSLNNENEVTILWNKSGQGSVKLIQKSSEGCIDSIQLSVNILDGQHSIKLKINDIAGFAGDEIIVPIILEEKSNHISAEITGIRTELIFNPTLLNPHDHIVETIDTKTAKISFDNLPIDIENGEALTNVKFTVGLGNAENCELLISNSETIGGDVEIINQSGKFSLLGICYEGGTRLLNPKGKVGIMNISPNPAENILTVEIDLIEKGQTELYIVNLLGVVVSKDISGFVNKLGTQSVTIDMSEFNSGYYSLILRTPTYMESRGFMILK